MQCNQNVKAQAVMMNFGRSVLCTLTSNDSAPGTVKFSSLRPLGWRGNFWKTSIWVLHVPLIDK